MSETKTVVAEPENQDPKKKGKEKKPPSERLTFRTRGGVRLTKAQVKEIKAGRKKLRKDLRAKGLKKKSDFESTAASMGLYFDKNRFLLFLWWLFGGKGRWWLLGAAALLLGSLAAMSAISQMRGYFTINLSDRLFREGFVMSETADFAQPATSLFAEPAVDVPCISITSIPADVDDNEGQHEGLGYFGYTYFLRNEGESTVDYKWELQVVGESLDISKAAWVMVIEDGGLNLYAEALPDGTQQMVPAAGVNNVGFNFVPALALARDPAAVQQLIASNGPFNYYRLTPTPFVDEDTVATGFREQIAPQEVHKYTIVVWLEGDDPDCTDELIGGHLGLNMQYALIDEEEEGSSFWNRLLDSLIFWDKKTPDKETDTV